MEVKPRERSGVSAAGTGGIPYHRTGALRAGGMRRRGRKASLLREDFGFSTSLPARASYTVRRKSQGNVGNDSSERKRVDGHHRARMCVCACVRHTTGQGWSRPGGPCSPFWPFSPLLPTDPLSPWTHTHHSITPTLIYPERMFLVSSSWGFTNLVSLVPSVTSLSHQSRKTLDRSMRENRTC